MARHLGKCTIQCMVVQVARFDENAVQVEDDELNWAVGNHLCLRDERRRTALLLLQLTPQRQHVVGADAARHTVSQHLQGRAVEWR
jgi:hypothetical protein